MMQRMPVVFSFTRLKISQERVMRQRKQDDVATVATGLGHNMWSTGKLKTEVIDVVRVDERPKDRIRWR